VTAPPADPLPADPPDQQAAIAFLSRPASYGLAGGRVERIASHCSIVFLAADRAYKLKRAIRYAALDYTTLAARRAACEAELTLNRRTAPALYLAVRRITRDEAGRLAFDGPGETLDCVVMMRRFAQADLLDAMAPAGALTPALMRALGAGIARFHLAAARRPDHGGSAAVARVIADNARELARFTRPADGPAPGGPAPGGPLLDGEAVAALGRRAEASLASLAPLLDRRRASGWVRRCHGDLRLANICLFRGRPTLFDCIEFSDEIGCIDTLHDLAFLLMDLELRGRRDLANALFNADQDAAPRSRLAARPAALPVPARRDPLLRPGRQGLPADRPGRNARVRRRRAGSPCRFAPVSRPRPAAPDVPCRAGRRGDPRPRRAPRRGGQFAARRAHPSSRRGRGAALARGRGHARRRR
ncbi:unnamed protein product, partial [Acidocella sp. C78]